VRVAGDPTGEIEEFHDSPTGLLLGAENGLFRYDGNRTIHVESDPTSYIEEIHNTPAGLLLTADNGLFRYDGNRTIHVESDPTSYIEEIHNTPAGLLLAADNSLFHFDGKRVAHVDAGDPADYIERVVRAEGDPEAHSVQVLDTRAGLLLHAVSGLFRVILQPLAHSMIVLENVSQLNGAVPSQLGVPHPLDHDSPLRSICRQVPSACHHHEREGRGASKSASSRLPVP
jgi:hypothetical protein